MNTILFVHDNGSRPFKVILSETNIEIWRQDAAEIEAKNYRNMLEEKNPKYGQLVNKYQYQRIWIPGSDRLRSKGNAILAHLVTPQFNTYLFVGYEVFTFVTPELIETFESDIGNNDVPYPYAFSANYGYFLLDKGWTWRNQVECNDPYQKWYFHRGIVKFPMDQVYVLAKND